MAKKPPSLSHLSQKWLEAKAAEESARNHRIALEEEIETLIPGPLEGSTSTEADGIKITVTRKLNRSVDYDAYKEVAESIPASLTPIRIKYDLDLKMYRSIEAANPDVFKIVQKFVEVKPAKTAIKVEVLG